MTDPVNHPPHYKSGGMEVIDVIEAFGLEADFYLGNVVKYVLRAGRKGELSEDLRKAAWYLQRKIGSPRLEVSLKGAASPLYYLATPYTDYPTGHSRAFMDAAKLAAGLLATGRKVYSPIAHCHPIAANGGPPPGDHEFWLPFDEAMMTAAHVLIVAHMDGWDRSKGIAHEVEFFERAGKPIYDLDPGTMLMVRREDVRERALV